MGSHEADLARRAKGGDEAAWHEIADRYGTYLYRLAFSLTGNAADAEDVLQETFAGALRHLRDFQERSTIKTWLCSILVRQAARLHRSRKSRQAVALDDAGPATPNNPLDTRMDVMAALGTLSPEHREVIVLRELQGMSYDEIAQILAAPRGTVESRLFRARQALRERLKGYLT